VLSPLDYLRFALALGVVLALIVALGWVLRRTSFGRAATGAHGRLGVLDSLQLDPRRRLVLVRRDGIEHLLLLAPTHELVVETGIKPLLLKSAPQAGGHAVAAEQEAH
jgi:flagellar protein FliO/FliZ